MRERLYWGWWIYYTLCLCIGTVWTWEDAKKHQWVDVAADSAIQLITFFIAHFNWEKGYYEE